MVGRGGNFVVSKVMKGGVGNFEGAEQGRGEFRFSIFVFLV